MVARGDIWWYEEPAAKRRPVLILTRDEALTALNQVLAVPLTTTIRGIPTEVELGRGDELPRSCVVSLDNLQPVVLDFCMSKITELGPHRMSEVCEALHAATGC